MTKPKYYLAVFGEPNPPLKDKVELGKYYLGERNGAIPGEPGDIILLYCTNSYYEHPMEVPGVGIILNKTEDSIYYRYLPLLSPIAKDDIDKAFIEEDRKKFSNIRFNRFWIFEISKKSFMAAIKDIPIDWP